MNRIDEIAELKGIGAKAKGYTIKEASIITGIDRRMMYRAIDAGDLDAVDEINEVSCRRFIKSDELQRWVDSL